MPFAFCLLTFAFLPPPPLHAQIFDPKIIATTGAITTTGETIANINAETSLNDSGMVAFVATVSSGATTGSAVLASDGTGVSRQIRKISFAGLSTSRVYAFPQINNSNKVVARDRVSGETPAYLIRTWDAAPAPGPMTIVASTTDEFFDSITLPTIANDGGIGFVGVSAGGTQTKLYMNVTGTRGLHFELASLTGGGFRPMAADGGRVLMRRGGNDSDPIVLFGGTSSSTIASTPAFSKLGRAPGISDNGSAVAFYGEDDGGPGIFLGLKSGSGWIVQRVAGTSGTTGFLSFDSQNRVGVEYLASSPAATIVVVYVATGMNGKTGIFTTRVDVSQSPPLTFRSTLVVEQGPTIPGLAGAVDGFSLNDPISAEGQIVSWVSTGSAQAVVRFDPRPQLPDLIAELPDSGLDFPNGFDPGDSGTVTVRIKNIGGADALGSPIIQILLSEKEGDPSPPAYQLLGEISNRTIALQPNQSKAETIPITIPSDLEHGRYQFIARVDTADAIEEGHEGNNEGRSRPFPVALPNLTGEFTLTDFPNGPALGGSGNLAARVRNPTDFTAVGGRMRVTFYLSKDQKIDSGVDYVLGHFLAGPPFILGPQQSLDCEAQNVLIPSGITPCDDYFFLAKIDADNQVDEVSEDNNTISSSVFLIKAGPNDPNPPVIADTIAKQDNSGKDTAVVVTFRYSGPQARELTILLSASADDGVTWTTVPVNTNTVSGDRKVQATRNGQIGTLRWNAGIDWPENYSEKMKVRVTDECSDKAGTSGTFTLDTRRKFEIMAIKSQFSTSKSGTQPVIFLDEVPFDVQFTVDVDWDGREPGNILFKAPGRPAFTQPHTSNSALFNMGRDFGPGGRLTVMAIDAAGVESPSRDANIEVAAQLEAFQLYDFIRITRNLDFSYEGKLPVNQEIIKEEDNMEVPGHVPIFGGHKFGLKSIMSLNVEVDNKGKARFSVPPITNVKDSNTVQFAGLKIGGDIAAKVDWQYVIPTNMWNFDGGSVIAAIKGEKKFGPSKWILVVPVPVPPFTLPVPVHLRGIVEASFSSEIGVTGFANDKFTLTGSLAGSLGGNVIPGFGFAELLSLELVVGAKASTTYQFDTFAFKDSSIAIRGTARAVALLWSWETRSLEIKWPESAARSAILLAFLDIRHNPGQLLPRDYLDAVAVDIGTSGGSREIAQSTEETTIVADVFPYSQPILKGSADHVALLWITDDATRSDANRTSLSARVWHDGAWSEDRIVDADGTADFAPTLAATSTGFVAAWEDFNAILADNVELPDMLAAEEISVSHYNSSTGLWSAPGQLTNNAILDRSPSVAAAGNQALLVWIRNENNDFLGREADPNKLMFATFTPAGQWSTPAVIVNGLGAIVKTALIFDGASGVYLFVVDADGDLSTDLDQELYKVAYNVTTGWGGLVRLTFNELVDANPRLIYDTHGELIVFWYQDGAIMMATNANLENASPVITTSGDSASSDFRVTMNSLGQLSVTWASASNAGQDLFNAVLDLKENRWSAPIQITDDIDMERSLTTAYLDDGTLIAAYNKVPINNETQDVDVDGKTVAIEVPVPDWTHVSLTSLIHPITGDLTVTNVEFAPENPLPGTDTVISVTIENVGDLAARGVQVGFYDGDPSNGGVRIGELRALSTVLGSGSSAVAATTWRVPENATTGHDIHVVVDPQNRYNERNEDNNRISAAVLTADLVLEDHAIETLSPTSYLVQALVANRGVIPANNAVVRLRRTDGQGPVFAEETVSLAANAERSLSFLIEAENSGTEDFVIHIAADPDNLIVESSETNNTGSSTAVRVKAPEPAISPPSGVYNQPQNVVIDCPIEDCDVRYTLDGSIPDASSNLYTGPITVSSFTTVTARTFTTGRDPSPVVTAQYIFGTENRPPLIEFIGVESIESEELSVNLLAEASDIDNGPNPLTYTWSMPNPGDGVTFGPANGTTTGRKVMATFPHSGTYTLTLTVTDGGRSVVSNLSVALPLDRDIDGMPDAWEVRFWDNLAHDGAEDFDGDGNTNVEEYRNGTNPILLAPAAPVPMEPANGSLTGLSPTLTASAFGGVGQTRHAASHWQVAAGSDFAPTVWDSGEVAPSTSTQAPTGVLSERTRYYWRVRYKNDSGESGSEWSAWSNHASPAWSFSTVTAFPFADDFSGDKGWSGFVAGFWERRAATAGGGANGSPDPGIDTSPSNDNSILGFAIGADYPVDMGVLEIISPPIDCRGRPVVELRFRRWLGVDTDNWAHAGIEITNDGGENWRPVWENGTTAVADSAWTDVVYDLSATAANQSTVQVKFSMGPMSLSLPYCGWNIDDLEIRAGAERLAEVTLETNAVEVRVGDSFEVRVYVQENSAEASGFRGGPLDIQFPAALVGYNGSFSSSTAIQAPFNSIQTSGSLQAGRIDELGGVTTLNGFGDGAKILYAILRFKALAVGTAQIAGAPGEAGFALTPPVKLIDSRRVFYGDALFIQIKPVVVLPIIQVFLEGPRDPVPKNTNFEIKVFAQENSATATGFLGGPIDLFFDPDKVEYPGVFDPNDAVQAPYKSLGIVSGTLEAHRINELGGVTFNGGSGNGVPVLYAKLTFRAVVEGTATFHAAAGESGLALTAPVGLVASQLISYGTPLTVDISATPVAILTSFPSALTNSRTAEFVVGGSTITDYRLKVDGGAYSGEVAVATPISLTSLAEGQHTLAVVGRSSLGFVQPESSPTTYTWTIDATPPSAPVVAVDSPTINRRPTWSWSPDNGGNGTFRYQLNSEAGSWTETTARAFTPSSAFSADGSYRLYVQERDAAGNWSLSGSGTVVIDTAGPTPGTVRDGQSADIDAQTSLTEIAANWSGFSDAGTGIVSYEWAIGTSAGGAETQNWTPVGNATSAIKNSLSLNDGTTYYVSVRAIDHVGNVGAVASSDGVAVKTVVAFKFAAAGYAITENASTVTIEVIRTGGSPRAAEVDYASANGSATAGIHFVGAAGRLSFAVGQASASFTVTITNNSAAGDKVANLLLKDPDTGSVLDTATLTLIDDDGGTQLQVVFPHQLNIRSAPGSEIGIDIMYTTSTNDNTLRRLFLGIHFDASRLTFNGLTSVLSQSLVEQPQEFPDGDDLDGDPSTDRYIYLPWLDASGNWPNQPLPIRLALASFTLTGEWPEGSQSFVRFSSDFGATSYTFMSRPVKVEFRTGSAGIDVDGDNHADALTDGLLIQRYLVGLRGADLIGQAVAIDCNRCDAAAIVELLDSAHAEGKLDVDGDGNSDAATDGMLILRYLFGFRGSALTDQINVDGCSNCTSTAIEDYFGSLDLQ